jgi:hypothetical protein
MASDSKLPKDQKFYLNSKRFKLKVKDIKRRGHCIGFHPGYYTYDNFERWNSEKRLLEDAVKDQISEGRQHYLRFSVPDTFRIWDKNYMEFDSTLGYADHEGFRCGTGDNFSVFDFHERRQLHIKEIPLIIMDGTLRRYSKEKAQSIIQYYLHMGRRYNSKITLLFHNSTFYGEEWEGYDILYLRSLQLLS